MTPPRSSIVRVAVVATHIAPARGYGGIAEATGRMLHAWAAAGRAIAVCSSDASEGRPLTPAEVGLPDGAPVRLFRATVWRRWGFGVAAPAMVLQTCREAAAVYVSGIATWPTSLAGLVCRLLRRPYVVAVHGGLMPGHVDHIRRHKRLKWLFYRLITLPTLRAARAVHACSGLEADGVRALLPAVPVVVVPNALDLAAWALAPPRPPDGSLVIAYIGRLSPEKGVLPFLSVWLGCRRPNDRLVIAGSGEGAYADEVLRLARVAGSAVDVHGYVPAERVRTVVAGADFVVLPSAMGEGGLRENFGNVVVEAMALGRPALVSRGMAWDDLEERGCGLVFDPDPDSARTAILRAQALDPGRRAAMGAAARRDAQARFDLGPNADLLWRTVTGGAVD